MTNQLIPQGRGRWRYKNYIVQRRNKLRNRPPIFRIYRLRRGYVERVDTCRNFPAALIRVDELTVMDQQKEPA